MKKSSTNNQFVNKSCSQPQEKKSSLRSLDHHQMLMLGSSTQPKATVASATISLHSISWWRKSNRLNFNKRIESEPASKVSTSVPSLQNLIFSTDWLTTARCSEASLMPALTTITPLHSNTTNWSLISNNTEIGASFSREERTTTTRWKSSNKRSVFSPTD